MKYVNKVTVLIMICSLVLSLVGCGSKNDEASVNGSESSTVSEDVSASGESEMVSSVETEQEVSSEEVIPEAEEMTALLLVEKMAAAAEGKQILQTTASMEMVMSMAAEELTMEMAMTSVSETKVSLDPYVSYSDTEMTIDMSGQQMTERSQVYTMDEDGVLVSYMHTDSTDQWMKLDMGTSADLLDVQYTGFDWMLAKPEEELVLQPELQMVGDREAYVMSCTLTGQEMQQALNGMSGLEDMLAESGLESLDYTMLNVPTVYYIDAETYLPIKYEMDIEGMGEMMTSLMSGLSEGTDLGMSIDISKVHAVYTDISYDPVEMPALPQEAIAATEQAGFDPDQGDGTYIIQESGAAVKITCPEGMTVTDTTYDSITLQNNDSTQMIVYTMYKDATSADFVTYIEETEVPSIQDADMYISHSAGSAIGSYETMILESTVANIYYAWAPMGDGWLFISMYDFNGLGIEDALTPYIEAAEGWKLQ